VDPADIKAFLARHQESFLRRDARALAADHATDGTFESPAHGVVTGRDAIEGVYRYWFTAFPDLALTWTDPLVGVDRATFFWDFTGTAIGPFFGMAGAGARVTMVGAADYRFAGDLIRSARHIFDFSGMLLKTGALKVKPK
jgi:predicted ester cyclase